MSKLKEFWGQVDHKTVWRFGVLATFLWLLFVGLFYSYFLWSDSQLISENKEVLKEIRLADSEGRAVFSPQFSEGIASSPAESPSKSGTAPLAHRNNSFDEKWNNQSENALLPTGPKTLPTEDIYAHKDLMDKYLSSGRPDLAYAHEQRISQIFQNDIVFLQKSARMSLDLGNFSDAHSKAQKALQLNPKLPEAISTYLMSLYRMGYTDSVLAMGPQFIEKYPLNLELLTTLGTIEIEARSKEAGNDRWLKKALSIDPDYSPALYQLGRKGHKEGNFDDARQAFEQILTKEPTHAKARGQLAVTYFYLGLDELAEKAYLTALALNPEDFNTWYNFGEYNLTRSYRTSQLKEGRSYLIKALENYQTALALNPGHPQANFRLGVLLLGNKQFREAITHLEKTLQDNPGHIRALLQLSLAYEGLNMPTEALAYLERAFKLDPGNKAVIFKIRELSTWLESKPKKSISG